MNKIPKPKINPYISTKLNQNTPPKIDTVKNSNMNKPQISSPNNKTPTPQNKDSKQTHQNTTVVKNANIYNQSVSQYQPVKTFAETTASQEFPKKDQAIIFNTIDGIAQVEYVLALSKITPPTNIIYASRISNNRFCVYFKNKTIVDDLVEKHPQIHVNDNTVYLRKLSNPAKRIIISNAHPIIPHNIIENKLSEFGVKLISPLSFMKAGFNIEGLEHIVSFRRYIFINPDDSHKLPGTTLIDFDNTEHRIFISDDTLICYLCKKPGHTTNHCNNVEGNNNTSTSKVISSPITTTEQLSTSTTSSSCNLYPEKTDINAPTNHNQTSTTYQFENHTEHNKMDWTQDPPSSEPTHSQNNTQNHNQITISHTNQISTPTIDKNKRPISCTSSVKSHNLDISLNNINLDKNSNANTKKKPKIRSRSNSPNRMEENKDNDTLKLVEEIFLNDSDIQLTLNQFRYIIDNFSNKTINIHTLCKEVDTDITSLMGIIDKVRPKIENRNMKTKLTKLNNLLFKSLPPANQDYSQ